MSRGLEELHEGGERKLRAKIRYSHQHTKSRCPKLSYGHSRRLLIWDQIFRATHFMENDSTFVAPEGVYSVTDEHKPNHAQNIAMSVGTAVYPSKVSTVVLRFPIPKQGSNAPGFAHLLGGGKSEPKKDKTEKAVRDRDDGVSLSSSDTPDEGDGPAPSSQEQAPGNPEHHTLFSHQSAGGKRKAAVRPKHNIRTTSSSFISRIQTAEGLTKLLQAKQGDVTFLFYNMAKSFVWIEAGSKAKVRLEANGARSESSLT